MGEPGITRARTREKIEYQCMSPVCTYERQEAAP